MSTDEMFDFRESYSQRNNVKRIVYNMKDINRQKIRFFCIPIIIIKINIAVQYILLQTVDTT
jgi:hypothetical protein